MTKFLVYDSTLHRDEFVKMNVDYLSWLGDEVLINYKLDLNEIIGAVEGYVENSLPLLESLVLPESVIFIVSYDDRIAGMGGLKKYDDETVEIKRMYVKPEFRGKGIGRALMNQLIDTAKDSGYSKLRLDTGKFMEAAQKVYRNAGFLEIEEYPRSEVPEEIRPYWIYMEKIL